MHEPTLCHPGCVFDFLISYRRSRNRDLIPTTCQNRLVLSSGGSHRGDANQPNLGTRLIKIIKSTLFLLSLLHSCFHSLSPSFFLFLLPSFIFHTPLFLSQRSTSITSPLQKYFYKLITSLYLLTKFPSNFQVITNVFINQDSYP